MTLFSMSYQVSASAWSLAQVYLMASRSRQVMPSMINCRWAGLIGSTASMMSPVGTSTNPGVSPTSTREKV